MTIPLRLRRVFAVLTLSFVALGSLPGLAAGGPLTPPPQCTQPTGGDFTCTGKILIGQPGTGLVGGLSEYGSACDPNGNLHGLDSGWIGLPESTQGYAARLTFESPAGDANLFVGFYDANCRYMSEYTAMFRAPRNLAEQGLVPHGAGHAVVGALEGRDINYTFTAFTSREPFYEPLTKLFAPAPPEAFSVDVGKDETGKPIQLRGHIHKPRGDGPFATVLSMTPYWNSIIDGPSNRSPLDSNHNFLVEAGFAVALINLRGSGDSDGDCWHWGDPTDVSDVGKVIEALAAQPWSNGKVGMYGHSFGGWSAMMGLASGAEPLKAVAAGSPVIDPLSLYSLRGVLQLPNFVIPVKTAYDAGNLVFTSQPEPDPSRGTRPECKNPTDPDRMGNDISHLPPVWNGDRTRFYEEVDLRPHIEGSAVPAFVASGLIPPMAGGLAGVFEGEGHILQFEGLWDLLGGNVRLLLGQWEHAWPRFDRPDYPAMVVAWFNEHLYDGPKVFPTGVVEYQDDLGIWKVADRWPSPAEERFLLSDGALVKHREEVVPSGESFVGIGSPCLRVCLSEAEGIVEATSLPTPGTPACIPNNVAFVSEPLRDDIHLAGNFTLDMKLSSTLEDGNLYAYLIETDATDCSDSNARIVARATADLRHIFTDEGRPFPVSEETNVTMLSLPFATTLRAGKRLVLAIGGDGREGIAVPDRWRPRITIHTGDPESGALWLPVVVEPPIAVQIDIKPGSDDNPINTNSAGSVPVAILTTDSFDALSVDTSSVRFGPAGARVTRSHVEDVDADGDLDLLLHFEQTQTGLRVGDYEACLDGITHDGRNVRGCDRVRVR